MHSEAARVDAGFTLIETVVALVILGAVMIAFFDFLSGALTSARRMEAASLAYDHRTNALEIASAINPMETPEGTLNLGTYRVHWASQQIGSIRQSSRYPAGPGIFKVGLYRVTLDFPNDKEIAPVEVTRFGFRRDNVPMSPMTSDQPAIGFNK